MSSLLTCMMPLKYLDMHMPVDQLTSTYMLAGVERFCNDIHTDPSDRKVSTVDWLGPDTHHCAL